VPPQREIIAAVTTSASETATSAGWGTQIEEAEAEKKKQETEGKPEQKSTQGENNASNEKQRKKIKRQAQKRKAEDNAKIEEENIVKRRFQQKELESAKERQEQLAKEHGIEIETTLNGEEKCGLHACADQTAEEKNSTQNRIQEKKSESASMIPQAGSEEKCGSPNRQEGPACSNRIRASKKFVVSTSMGFEMLSTVDKLLEQEWPRGYRKRSSIYSTEIYHRGQRQDGEQ
jgi:hypothetical protein